MDALQKMSKDEVKEFFSKNWLTHDAMWYGSCVHELGAEKANKLNKSAVRLMAGIEIKRILALMEKPKGYEVKSFNEVAEVIDMAFRLVQTNFMKFDFSFPKKNVLLGQYKDCFAYNGVKKFGLADAYDCGVVERVKGWLDGLGVEYNCTDFSGCLMHQCGECVIVFHFNLN